MKPIKWFEKIRGMSVSAGSFEHGLWFDADKKKHQDKGMGVKLNIVVGYYAWPVPKFYKKEWWQKDPAFNEWKTMNYWFRVTIPVPLPGVFLSFSFHDWGFYIGCKDYNIDPLPKDPWAPDELRGTQALCLSMRITSNRGNK